MKNKVAIYVELLPFQKLSGEGIFHNCLAISELYANNDIQVDIYLPKYTEVPFSNYKNINFIKIPHKILFYKFILKNLKKRISVSRVSKFKIYKLSFINFLLRKLLILYLLKKNVRKIDFKEYIFVYIPIANVFTLKYLKCKKAIVHLPDVFPLKYNSSFIYKYLFLNNLKKNIQLEFVKIITTPSLNNYQENISIYFDKTQLKNKISIVDHKYNILSSLIKFSNTTNLDKELAAQLQNYSYIFYPSQNRKYKNIYELIEIFKEVSSFFPKLYLVLTALIDIKHDRIISLGRINYVDYKFLIENSLMTISASRFEASTPYAASESIELGVPFFLIKNKNYSHNIKSDIFYFNISTTSLIDIINKSSNFRAATVKSQKKNYHYDNSFYNFFLSFLKPHYQNDR